MGGPFDGWPKGTMDCGPLDDDVDVADIDEDTAFLSADTLKVVNTISGFLLGTLHRKRGIEKDEML